MKLWKILGVILLGMAVLTGAILVAIPGDPNISMEWHVYQVELLAQARQTRKPVMIDFFADWCAPCKELDAHTFTDAAVIKATKDFVKLKVDLTKADSPDAQAMVNAYGIQGVPTVVFLDPDGRERRDLRVVQYLSPDKFLDRISRLKSSQDAGFPSSPGTVRVQEKQERPRDPVASLAPELDVSEWIRGGTNTLESLRGKVVLLDFFQIICPGCHAAHPIIAGFQERYEQQGLAVLGIAVAFEYQSAQRPDRIKAYVKSNAYPYPVAIDSNMTNTFYKYQSRGTPWCVLIDQAGRVRHMGFFRDKQIESIIQHLLAEKS